MSKRNGQRWARGFYCIALFLFVFSVVSLVSLYFILTIYTSVCRSHYMFNNFEYYWICVAKYHVRGRGCVSELWVEKTQLYVYASLVLFLPIHRSIQHPRAPCVCLSLSLFLGTCFSLSGTYPSDLLVSRPGHLFLSLSHTHTRTYTSDLRTRCHDCILQEAAAHVVKVVRDKQGLGLNIRGGAEFQLGLFVSKVRCRAIRQSNTVNE